MSKHKDPVVMDSGQTRLADQTVSNALRMHWRIYERVCVMALEVALKHNKEIAEWICDGRETEDIPGYEDVMGRVFKIAQDASWWLSSSAASQVMRMGIDIDDGIPETSEQLELLLRRMGGHLIHPDGVKD